MHFNKIMLRLQTTHNYIKKYISTFPIIAQINIKTNDNLFNSISSEIEQMSPLEQEN